MRNAGFTWRRLRCAALLVLLATGAFVPRERAEAQFVSATVGTVGGFIAGTLVTTGIVVLEARLGKYVYGMDELTQLRPELLPMVVLPIAGGVLGATSRSRLARVGTGAAVGLGAGIALGIALGDFIWASPEGRWAGGTIGAAAGLLTGAIIYGVRPLDKPNAPEAPAPTIGVSFSIPWSGK